MFHLLPMDDSIGGKLLFPFRVISCLNIENMFNSTFNRPCMIRARRNFYKNNRI